MNDPSVIAQVDARRLNIESKVELRFANNEKRIDEFVEQPKVMMQNADENDKRIKAEVRDRFAAVEASNATKFAEVSAALSVAQASNNAALKNMEDKIANELDTLKNVINAQSGRISNIETDGPVLTNRLAQA